MNEYLPDEIVVIHNALAAATIPHAFGGAIALATVFPLADRQKAERELTHIAQTRLRWGALPVDLFFANTPFHEELAKRTRDVEYIGTIIPVISAEDLILCKAFFNRPKDWFDIENIIKVQAHLDVGYLHRWLQAFPDPDGERTLRLDRLLAEQQGNQGPEQG